MGSVLLWTGELRTAELKTAELKKHRLLYTKYPLFQIKISNKRTLAFVSLSLILYI